MRVDRMGFVESVDGTQLIVRPPPRAGYRVRPEYYVSLSDVVALEVYRNHDEGPDDWKMDMPNCAFIQVWTSRAW